MIFFDNGQVIAVHIGFLQDQQGKYVCTGALFTDVSANPFHSAMVSGHLERIWKPLRFMHEWTLAYSFDDVLFAIAPYPVTSLRNLLHWWYAVALHAGAGKARFEFRSGPWTEFGNVHRMEGCDLSAHLYTNHDKALTLRTNRHSEGTSRRTALFRQGPSKLLMRLSCCGLRYIHGWKKAFLFSV